jgi:hypothetical protein
MLHRISVFCLFVFFANSAAFGLCQYPKLRVDDEFFRSDAIFIGTPIAEKHLPNDDEWLETVYTVRPSKWLHGHIDGLVTMRTTNDSGRFELEVGKPNLVFAKRASDGSYFADNCGNTMVLSKAANTLKELRQTPHPGRSYLYGICINGDCAHGTAIAVSGTKQWKVHIDDTGNFIMNVPPGIYQVRIVATNSSFSGYELSYNRPDHVIIPEGSSGGVAFSKN